MLLDGLDADVHVTAVDEGAADARIDGCYRTSDYIAQCKYVPHI